MRATPAESRREAAGVRDWLAHNAWRVVVLFLCLLLPLAGFVALYTVLMIIEIKLMLKAIRKGPGDALAAPQPSVSHHATGQA